MKRQPVFTKLAVLASLASVWMAMLPPAGAEPDAAPGAREPGRPAQAGLGTTGQNLPDPTRPSAVVLTEPAGATPGGDGGLLRLQSVLLGKSTGRVPAALINGELVPLGGSVGDAKLMRLTEHGAVLQGPQGRTTLLLIAGVEKRASAHRNGDADLRIGRPAASAGEIKP